MLCVCFVFGKRHVCIIDGFFSESVCVCVCGGVKVVLAKKKGRNAVVREGLLLTD